MSLQHWSIHPYLQAKRPISGSLRLPDDGRWRAWCEKETSVGTARQWLPQRACHRACCFPIGVHHIGKMLELGDLTLTQTRNLMLTIVGTVMCMWVNELDQLQKFATCYGVSMEGFTPCTATRLHAACINGSKIPQGKASIHEPGALYSHAPPLTWTEPGGPRTTSVRRSACQVHVVAPACLSFPESSTTQPQPMRCHGSR